MGAYTAAEMNPQLFPSAVTMPVLMFQVLEDAWTKNPEDAQKTFDLISSAEKELLGFFAYPRGKVQFRSHRF